MKKEKKSKLEQLLDPAGEFYPYLDQLLDAIPFSILITNERSEVCYANTAYYDHLGASFQRDSVLGLPTSSVTDTPVVPEVIRDGQARYGVYKLYASGKPYCCDIKPLRADGTIVGTISYGREYRFHELYHENDTLEKTNQKLLGEINTAYHAGYTFEDYWGKCENILDVKKRGAKMACTDSDILIMGESGTGKEIFAQAIHNASRRAHERFVAINCATLNSSLIASELFGYTEGSFTGALKGGKPGLFETAHRGTLLLDEIGELDLDLQAKLLRVLQERTVRRIGSNTEKAVDVRVIALTNKDLPQMIRQGTFRADLYYRLNVLTIDIPPLRARRDDIPYLAERILRSATKQTQRHLSFSPEALKLMVRYSWPGNVRELRNAVQYAALMCERDLIGPADLPQWLRLPVADPVLITEDLTLDETLQQVERQLLHQMLDFYGDSLEAKKKIAQRLGISVSNLYGKLRKMEEVSN